MDSFRKLIESAHYMQNAAADRSTDECNIEEEADTYGFSLVSTAGSSRTGRSSSNENILDAFRNDSNWNNPASVALMSRAYGITDEYECLLLPSQTCAEECNYMLIKAKQNNMFAKRRFADGVMHKDKGSVADSVKSFGEAIYFDNTYVDAYIERAGQYIRLGKHMEALGDYKAVLAQQPEHTHAMQQYMSLCRQLGLPTSHGCGRYSSLSSASLHAYDFGGDDYPSKDTSQHSNKSSAAKPESTTSGNVGLISKLQQVLRKDPTKLLDPTSSDSSTSSSDSESSTDSDEKSRKRKRKDHKDRRSKESRSAKKRKSKDKKDKRRKSSKHKTRKRDDNDY